MIRYGIRKEISFGAVMSVLFAQIFAARLQLGTSIAEER